jgi:hypothetical protein
MCQAEQLLRQSEADLSSALLVALESSLVAPVAVVSIVEEVHYCFRPPPLLGQQLMQQMRARSAPTLGDLIRMRLANGRYERTLALVLS